MIEAGAYEVVSFDCYGTLIDWETGLATALRETFGSAAASDGTDELLVSWMYSEGRSCELIRRSGDKLLFVGGFTDGA